MAGTVLNGTRPRRDGRDGRDGRAGRAGTSTGPTSPPPGIAPSGGRRDVRRRRGRLRAQWLVLAAALTVLAGVLVAWALDRAADRVLVVSVARPVAAGTLLTADDLTTTAIAFDGQVTGLVPATSLDALVGRMATIDLEPGALLGMGMWADGSELGPDERTVGAVLAPGTHPGGLAAGSRALAVSSVPVPSVPVSSGTTGEATDEAIGVRVLDADTDDRGSLRVTLAVPAEHAAALARLAATESLVLVGVPPEQVP